MDLMEKVEEKPLECVAENRNSFAFWEIDFSQVHDDINQSKIQGMILDAVRFGSYGLKTQESSKVLRLTRQYEIGKTIKPNSEEQIVDLKKIESAIKKSEEIILTASKLIESIRTKKSELNEKLWPKKNKDSSRKSRFDVTPRERKKMINELPPSSAITKEFKRIDNKILAMVPEKFVPNVRNDPNGDYGYKDFVNIKSELIYRSEVMWREANFAIKRRKQARKSTKVVKNDPSSLDDGSSTNLKNTLSNSDNSGAKSLDSNDYYKNITHGEILRRLAEYSLLINKELVAFCKRHLKKEYYDPSWEIALDYVKNTKIKLIMEDVKDLQIE